MIQGNIIVAEILPYLDMLLRLWSVWFVVVCVSSFSVTMIFADVYWVMISLPTSSVSERFGAEEAHGAHNPGVGGSKPLSAIHFCVYWTIEKYTECIKLCFLIIMTNHIRNIDQDFPRRFVICKLIVLNHAFEVKPFTFHIYLLACINTHGWYTSWSICCCLTCSSG